MSKTVPATEAAAKLDNENKDGDFLGKEKKHVYDTDCYFSSCSCWRTAYLAAQ